jgi:biotin carboxyl carrier protein
MQAQLTQIQLALQETHQDLQSLANPEDQKRLDRERIALLQKEISSLEQLIGRAHVKASSAGRVLDIKVAGGDQVTKGSLLMEISISRRLSFLSRLNRFIYLQWMLSYT